MSNIVACPCRRQTEPGRAEGTEAAGDLVYRAVGAGKSTLAGRWNRRWRHKASTPICWMGTMRHGLCGDLGFDDAARQENIRRVGEVAKLMVDAGLIVLTAFISPFRAERDLVRNLVGEGSLSRCLWMRPLACAKSAIPRDSTRRRGRGNSQFHRHRLRLRGPRAAGNSSAECRKAGRCTGG